MSDCKEDGAPTGQRQTVELRVVRVPSSGVIKVRFLADVQTLHLHWVLKRAVPCKGTQCPVKVHSVQPEFCGFAAVEQLANGPPPVWVPAILEVTERLYAILPHEGIRGSVYHLFKRPGPGKFPVNSGDHVDNVDPRTLRADVDVWRHCERMYRCRGIQWGLQPLFDGPQLLDVTPGLLGSGAASKEADELADFVCLRPVGMKLVDYVDLYAREKDSFLAGRKKEGEAK